MLFRFFKKQNPILLGRWAHNSINEIQRKIDLANCDSCGTCGIDHYKTDKTDKTNKNIKTNNKTNNKNFKNEKFLLYGDDIINIGIN